MEYKFYLKGWEEISGHAWIRCIIARARMTLQEANIRNEILKTKGFNAGYFWEKEKDLSD